MTAYASTQLDTYLQPTELNKMNHLTPTQIITAKDDIEANSALLLEQSQVMLDFLLDIDYSNKYDLKDAIALNEQLDSMVSAIQANLESLETNLNSAPIALS